MKNTLLVIAGAALGFAVSHLVNQEQKLKETKTVATHGTHVVIMSPEPGVTCYLRGMNGVFCMRD